MSPSDRERPGGFPSGVGEDAATTTRERPGGFRGGGKENDRTTIPIDPKHTDGAANRAIRTADDETTIASEGQV